MLTSYNFKGGVNALDSTFVDDLNTSTKYSTITFNLKDSIDLEVEETKTSIIETITDFVRTIVFHNDENKDTKFTLTFSEVLLKLNDTENNLENIEVVAFKGPDHNKEHYYARINGKIDWKVAYNIASSLKFNGLQGYLLTVTSKEEHNFIYQSLGNIYGWMGAAAIKNADDITYNQKDISWQPAYGEVKSTYAYGLDTKNDDNVRTYWHWVAGPEAGQKLFDGYTNFTVNTDDTKNEPNNSAGNEWCAQYGQGSTGSWNDFKNNENAIQGYYIEFGGFPDEEETAKPVTLTNTYNWKDYDFRNIESEINEKIEVLTDEEKKALTKEEFETMVEEAITEAGVDNVNFEVDFKKFIVKILIGEEGNKTTYNLNVAKKLLRNPQTGDSLLVELIITISTLLTIIQVAMIYRKKYIY